MKLFHFPSTSSHHVTTQRATFRPSHGCLPHSHTSFLFFFFFSMNNAKTNPTFFIKAILRGPPPSSFTFFPKREKGREVRKPHEVSGIREKNGEGKSAKVNDLGCGAFLFFSTVGGAAMIDDTFDSLVSYYWESFEQSLGTKRKFF